MQSMQFMHSRDKVHTAGRACQQRTRGAAARAAAGKHATWRRLEGAVKPGQRRGGVGQICPRGGLLSTLPQVLYQAGGVAAACTAGTAGTARVWVPLGAASACQLQAHFK